MVSIRKAKKTEKMQAKLNAGNKLTEVKMSLDDAYSLVDKIYKNPDAVIDWRELRKALEVIGVSDAHFAAEMKKDFELREAYQVAGGYYQYGQSALQKTMDKRFQQALKLIEADDPEFANAVRNLSKEGITFKKADREQLLSAEQIAQNAQNIAQLAEDRAIAKDVDLREAFANTPVRDLSVQEAQDVVLNTAKLEIMENLAEAVEFNEGSTEQKRGMVVSSVRGSMERILLKARLSSVSKSVANIKKAFNFREKITVAPKSIASAYERAIKNTSAYIKRLSQKGHTKAAAFLNKAKTRVHSSMIKLATASLLLSACLPSCRKDNPNTETQAPAKQEKVVVPRTAPQKVATDSIAVPTEWADSLGVSKGNWTTNQTFLNYENAYKKITDDMLQKSGFQTRDQFLDAYRILRSFYPKVIENQGDVLRERSEVSEKFSKFFNNDDCVKANEFTAADFAILKIAPELRGNINRRATQEIGVNEDCAPGKVKYVSQKDKTVSPVDSVEQQPVVNDTIPQFAFEETGRSSERVVVKNDTVALGSIDVYKSNDLRGGQKIGSISAEQLTGAKVTEKKNVLVEATGSAGFVEEGSSRVETISSNNIDVFKGNSLDNGVKVGSVNVADITTGDVTNRKDVLVEQTSASGFIEEGSSRVEQAPASGFIEEGSSRVEQAPASGFIEEGKSTVVTTDADSIQVVEDSADLPVGTPSAGYVDERGGVNNTGLTAKQLEYSKSKILATYGKSAYNDLMEGISDEMLSKGNIFEGLTREQAIYNLSVWSVSFPHSAETSLIYDYVLNCHKGEKMSQEDMAKAKAAMDRVRENKTIDGVVYNKPIYVKNVKNMGCDEKVQITSATIDGVASPKSPSGPKFKRLFGLKPQRPEGFLEFGTSREVEEYIVSETKPLANITVHKANDLADSGEKIGEMTAKNITRGSVTNRKNVLVEKSKNSTPTKKEKKKTLKDIRDAKLKKLNAMKKYATSEGQAEIERAIASLHQSR